MQLSKKQESVLTNLYGLEEERNLYQMSLTLKEDYRNFYKVIKELEKRGYVTREKAEVGKEFYISISAKGAAYAEAFCPVGQIKCSSLANPEDTRKIAELIPDAGARSDLYKKMSELAVRLDVFDAAGNLKERSPSLSIIWIAALTRFLLQLNEKGKIRNKDALKDFISAYEYEMALQMKAILKSIR